MPGWTNIPVSAGGDMSLRATYLELMGAWNERLQALGQATVTNPAVGDPCFQAAAAYGIKTMQDWIEANCTSFVVSHDAGSPPTLRADGYYDGAATIDMYTTATMRSTAGLNASGFRKTDTPTYGIAAAGDIVLIHHFNELRLAFNILAWTKLTGFLDTHSENIERIAVSAAYATWHAAYLDAVANWITATATSVSGGSAWAVCFGNFDGANYQCQLDRIYGYPEFSGISTFTSHEFDIYLISGIFIGVDTTGAVYFEHGDDVIQDAFSWIQTFTSATTSTRSGNKIGDIAIGNPPAEGPAPTNIGGNNSPYGWQNQTGGVNGQAPVGVIRWDFTYS